LPRTQNFHNAIAAHAQITYSLGRSAAAAWPLMQSAANRRLKLLLSADGSHVAGACADLRLILPRGLHVLVTSSSCASSLFPLLSPVLLWGLLKNTKQSLKTLVQNVPYIPNIWGSLACVFFHCKNM
jgi:hypothetical protein